MMKNRATGYLTLCIAIMNKTGKPMRPIAIGSCPMDRDKAIPAKPNMNMGGKNLWFIMSLYPSLIAI